MKNKLIALLDQYGFPVFLQGTLNPEEEYPETFITFWTDSVDDGTHFDNETTSFDWAFSIILYSSNPVIVNTLPDNMHADLKAAGFIPQGKGFDVASGNPTHTGWAMDVIGSEF